MVLNKDSISAHPWTTLGFTALSVLLYVLIGHGWDAPGTDALLSVGALSSSAIADGQVWRLLSAAFVHVDGLHLVTNVTVLMALGAWLEPTLGHRRFLVIFVVGVILGGLAAFTANPSTLVAGSSGGIVALMAGSVIVLGRRGLGLGGMVLLIATCLAIVTLGAGHMGIATSAHVGGLLGGVTAGLLFRGLGRRSPRRCAVTRAAYVCCGFLLCYALIATTIHATMQPSTPLAVDAWAQTTP